MAKCNGCGSNTVGQDPYCSSCIDPCRTMSHMGPPDLGWLPSWVCTYIDTNTGCVYHRYSSGGGFHKPLCPGDISSPPSCACSVVIDGITYSPNGDGQITLPPAQASSVTVSVNGGSPIAPDAAGNINIPVGCACVVNYAGVDYAPDASGVITVPGGCACVVNYAGTDYAPDASGVITIPGGGGGGGECCPVQLGVNGTPVSPNAAGVIVLPHAEDSDGAVVTALDPANHTIQITNGGNAGGPAAGTNGSPEMIGVKDFIPPYQAGDGACPGKFESALIADGLANTIPGQMFCANHGTFVNCDCASAKLVNYTEFEKLPFTEGSLVVTRFEPGIGAMEEEFTVFNAYTDLGAPDCVNAVELHGQMLFCHQRQGGENPMSVQATVALQAGPGTTYIPGNRFFNMNSGQQCSQSVSDFSDGNTATEIIPVDCDGNFWVRTIYLSDDPWDSNDPRDVMDTFMYLSGWGTVESPHGRTGKSIWDYHSKCGAA